jgi:hypothetical protein
MTTSDHIELELEHLDVIETLAEETNRSLKEVRQPIVIATNAQAAGE